MSKELTTEENIKRASEIVKLWPEWKIKNMKAVFSEPDIKVPKNEEIVK